MNEATQTTHQLGLEALEDSELLRRYASTGSEEAFAEIVRRRIGLVYSVALRQTRGDRHRAQDVCQTVFSDLARKAATLRDRPVIMGWLYRSAQFAAAGMIRAEQRRQNRENDAQLMNEMLRPEETNWDKVRPVLDEALGEIDERDRDVILLRFFDGRPFADIGSRMRLTENAARMRVERALERLGAVLARRGITSTSAALGVALGQQIGAATPAGLAAAVTGTALAQASATATGGWLAGVVGLTKLQIGITASIAAGGAAAFVVQHRGNAELRADISSLRAQEPAVAALRTENRRLTEVAAEVEQLRRDDIEFKQLADSVGELRKASEEQTRVARARQVQQAQSRDVQAEVDRMNREGNALVGQYKELAAKVKDPALTAEQKAAAEAASKLKLAEIQAKQREVQAFIAAARAANPGLELTGTGPKPQLSVAGEVEARKAKRAAIDESNGVASSPVDGGQISLKLPGAYAATVLAALETIVGSKIVRDPSLANVHGTVDFHSDKLTKGEAARSLAAALGQQLNVVLETAPDGNMVAKLAPPGWSFRAR